MKPWRPRSDAKSWRWLPGRWKLISTRIIRTPSPGSAAPVEDERVGGRSSLPPCWGRCDCSVLTITVRIAAQAFVPETEAGTGGPLLVAGPGTDGRGGRLDPQLSRKQSAAELAGVEVGAKQVGRCAESLGEEVARYEHQSREPESLLPLPPTLYLGVDGTGVLMRAPELQGRAGKQPDGSARTREAKLCTVWSAEKRDDQGRP